ncbi:MAG TPA: dTDP-4-dehydrorhamnose 3,5-epimerase family protein [Candidatus Woesebacteria bacterium]|nr:dTDP-4-dehydrorhamnose 3,5-epimerase family protein [Candidatus Woesebacteria bacterium]
MQIPSTYQPTETSKLAEGVYKTSINGLLYIDRPIITDNRGFFSEVVKIPLLEQIIGQAFVVKQVNHARSETNVVRGIHAEGWNKYVFVLTGLCFVAIVDVRPNFETFGNKEYFLLGTGENALTGCLFLPSGVGNSVCILEGPVDYLYLVDRLYQDRDTSGDVAISVFDPDLNIPWPIKKEEMIISERDTNTIMLREKCPEKFI